MVIYFLIVCIILFSLGWFLGTQAEKREFNHPYKTKKRLKKYEYIILPLTIGDSVFNFLVDTGSNVSLITKETLSSLPHVDYELTKEKRVTTDINNKIATSDVYNIFFQYKNRERVHSFSCISSEKMYNISLTLENHPPVHGILGIDFLYKYKYVIDLKQLFIYSD